MSQPELNPELVTAANRTLAAQTRSSAGLMTLAVIVLIGVLVGGWAVYHFNSASYRAEKACKAYILDQLTSPSTAKFSGMQFFNTDRPEVTGNVDSQNGFGAMVRGTISCDMVKSGGDWTVSDGYVI